MSLVRLVVALGALALLLTAVAASKLHTDEARALTLDGEYAEDSLLESSPFSEWAASKWRRLKATFGANTAENKFKELKQCQAELLTPLQPHTKQRFCIPNCLADVLDEFPSLQRARNFTSLCDGDRVCFPKNVNFKVEHGFVINRCDPQCTFAQRIKRAKNPPAFCLSKGMKRTKLLPDTKSVPKCPCEVRSCVPRRVITGGNYTRPLFFKPRLCPPAVSKKTCPKRVRKNKKNKKNRQNRQNRQNEGEQQKKKKNKKGKKRKRRVRYGKRPALCIPQAYRLFNFQFLRSSMMRVCPRCTPACIPKNVNLPLSPAVRIKRCPQPTAAKCGVVQNVTCLPREFRHLKLPTQLKKLKLCKRCQQACWPAANLSTALNAFPGGYEIPSCAALNAGVNATNAANNTSQASLAKKAQAIVDRLASTRKLLEDELLAAQRTRADKAQIEKLQQQLIRIKQMEVKQKEQNKVDEMKTKQMVNQLNGLSNTTGKGKVIVRTVYTAAPVLPIRGDLNDNSNQDGKNADGASQPSRPVDPVERELDMLAGALIKFALKDGSGQGPLPSTSSSQSQTESSSIPSFTPEQVDHSEEVGRSLLSPTGY